MIVQYKAEVVVAVEVEDDSSHPTPAALAAYLAEAASVDIDTEQYGVLPDDNADVVGIEINWDFLRLVKS